MFAPSEQATLTVSRKEPPAFGFWIWLLRIVSSCPTALARSNDLVSENQFNLKQLLAVVSLSAVACFLVVKMAQIEVLRGPLLIAADPAPENKAFGPAAVAILGVGMLSVVVKPNERDHNSAVLGLVKDENGCEWLLASLELHPTRLGQWVWVARYRATSYFGYIAPATRSHVVAARLRLTLCPKR